MIFPWQYAKKIKEYEARIAELKTAGWYAVNGWYRTTGYLKYEQYVDVCKDYKWEKSYRVFSKDQVVDGPRPDHRAFELKED